MSVRLKACEEEEEGGAWSSARFALLISNVGGISTALSSSPGWLAGKSTGLVIERLQVLESRQERRENFLLQSYHSVLALIRCPFYPRVTAVALNRPRSICRKCGWQVTAKHAHTTGPWNGSRSGLTILSRHSVGT